LREKREKTVIRRLERKGANSSWEGRKGAAISR